MKDLTTHADLGLNKTSIYSVQTLKIMKICLVFFSDQKSFLNIQKKAQKMQVQGEDIKSFEIKCYEMTMHCKKK